VAYFSLCLLISLTTSAAFVAAQDSTNGPPRPDPTDIELFPTFGPAPRTNTTFSPGPMATLRPPYTNTSHPINRPTLTRPDSGATITSWTTEIVTTTFCPCGPDYGYGHETAVEGCHNGYSGCKGGPDYGTPDYPESAQEPPHDGGDGEEGEGCSGDEYEGEGLRECYGHETGCGKHEYGAHGWEKRSADDQGLKGSVYNSKGKNSYGEYDRRGKDTGSYSRKGRDVYLHSGKGVHHKGKDKGGNRGVKELEGVPIRKGSGAYGHNLKGIDHKEARQRREKTPDEGYHSKKPQTYKEHGLAYEQLESKYEGKSLSYGEQGPNDKAISAAPKPSIKHYQVTAVAHHKREKRQHEHKQRRCTKTGGPKSAASGSQKHELTGGPTGPGQCYGGCGGPGSASATAVITIAPSVTKIIIHTTSRLPVNSGSLNPLPQIIYAQTETGSATRSFATSTSMALSSPMPTFIAGAVRLGREVQMTGGWGMLGIVAIGFGLGGLVF